MFNNYNATFAICKHFFHATKLIWVEFSEQLKDKWHLAEQFVDLKRN